MATPDPRQRSIGIFDSGFGGLTVMRAIRELMPNENIIYFGDTARLPYGNKSAQTLLRYSLENADFLQSHGIKILINACHTSCTASLDNIRKTCSVPIVGITEQGVEEVARLFPKDKVGILATRATINSGIYQQQLLERCPSIQLFPISCPLFVPLVEEGYIQHPLCTLAVQEYLQHLKKESIRALLLGCTHYPLLQDAIHQELGTGVHLIDPAIACAKQIRQILTESNLLANPATLPVYQFFVSDDPEKFRQHGKAFLNHPIENVSQKNA